MITDCSCTTDGRILSDTLDLAAIRGLLHGIRPDFDDTSDDSRAAVLLLAGPPLGFNIDRLSRRTRYPRPVVAVFARRLFDNGVWRHEGPVYCWQDATDADFWRDVDVAVGRAYRRSGADGKIEWGQVNSWRKKYDFGEDSDAPIAIQYVNDADNPGSVHDASRETPHLERRIATVVQRKPAARRSVIEPELTRVAESPLVRTVVRELFPDAKWL